MISKNSLQNCHRFSHPAMATVFEIHIAGEDAEYAEQAAQAAFTVLDLLEQELSRFIENSDISRINTLKSGQTIRIGPDAFECLHACKLLHSQTHGAFDITVGAFVDCWRNGNQSSRWPGDGELVQARQRTGLHRLELDAQEHTVKLAHGHPVALDLGGFGKGYAIDKVAELLQEWSIENAMIHGGTSSIFAIGDMPGKKNWPVTISNPFDPQQVFAKVPLQNRSMSGSGLQKGRHIIDPRTGQPRTGNHAAWASAPDAATSDALSTAFMVMSPDEIEAFCETHSEVRAMIFRDADVLQIMGGLWRYVVLCGQSYVLLGSE